MILHCHRESTRSPFSLWFRSDYITLTSVISLLAKLMMSRFGWLTGSGLAAVVRLYVRGLSRGKWKPVGGYVHGATLGDKGVYITETSGTNRGTWRSKIKTLMAMIVVQNGYPLCRNGGKFTPYLQKRQQRLAATNPPSFWSFLYSRLRSTITFECLPRSAQQNLG